jgi:hypothetical protein
MIIDNDLYIVPPGADGLGELFGYGKAGNAGAYSYATNAIDLGPIWRNIGIGTELFLHIVITEAQQGTQTFYIDQSRTEQSGGRRLLHNRSVSETNGTVGARFSMALPVYGSALPVVNDDFRYLTLKTYRSLAGESAGDASTHIKCKAIAYISATGPNTQQASKPDKVSN